MLGSQHGRATPFYSGHVRFKTHFPSSFIVNNRLLLCIITFQIKLFDDLNRAVFDLNRNCSSGCRAAWAFWSPLQRWEGRLGCVRLRLHRFVPGFPIGAPSLTSRPGLQPRSCAMRRHLGASFRPRDQRPLLAGWVWRNTAWGRVFDARTIIGHPPAAQVPIQITKL